MKWLEVRGPHQQVWHWVQVLPQRAQVPRKEEGQETVADCTGGQYDTEPVQKKHNPESSRSGSPWKGRHESVGWNPPCSFEAPETKLPLF